MENKRVERAIKNRLSRFTTLLNRRFEDMSNTFNVAVNVFKNVLCKLDEKPRNPEYYEADCLLVVDDYDLETFCDEFSAALYKTMEWCVRDSQSRLGDVERFIRWNTFCRLFSYKKFSKILQETILTCDFETFEKNGKKGFKATCNSVLWVFSWISGVEKLKENVYMAGEEERITAFQKYNF